MRRITSKFIQQLKGSADAGTSKKAAAAADLDAGMVCGRCDDQTELHRIVAQRSFVLSADTAHALHPNYAAKHESAHSPLLNKGTVIKSNGNQRYATNSVTGFLVRELGRIAKDGDVPLQEFVVRNDCGCGSTIGPIIARNTGVRTVDVGVASLSMHSIRET